MNTMINNKWMGTLLTIHCSLFISGAAALVSCSDWSDHYEDGPVAGAGQSVMQLLEQDAQTQQFAQLVRQAGYADLLSSGQSFTVFAPTSLADAASPQRLVANHIARQTYPTSTPSTTGVQMLNGKIYYFEGADNFAGSTVTAANEKADNGLVHRLSDQIPYVNNIYEHLEEQAPSLYDFIHQFDEVRMDSEASTEIDIDELGRPIYDTVFVSYNRLLQDPTYGLGSIATEDSIYTMLVPTDEAWQAAYERMAPYFRVYDADPAVADSIQDIRTKLAIVGDLIYRGSTDGQDSIVSTTGSVVHSPAALLAGTTRVKASNGIVFDAPVLNYDMCETWNKPINVEAEQQNGRTYNNTLTSVYQRNVTSASLIEGVSDDAYIEVLPISTSTNPAVIFDIPNILAGTYNVYAVFLPATVEGATEELDSTKVSFTVAYQGANGRSTSKRNTSKTNLTSGTQVTRMLAFEGLEIPVSNTTDRLWLMEEANDPTLLATTTQLTITTNVTTKEFSSKEFSRSFRLDRIIFEPVGGDADDDAARLTNQ